MKVLLALTFLLAFLALGLSEPDTDRDVELLRYKREPAGEGKEGNNKKRLKKKTRQTKPKKEKKGTKIAVGNKKKSGDKKGKDKDKTNKRTNKKNRKVKRKGNGQNIEKKKRKKERRRQRGSKKRGQGGKRINGRNTKTCSDSTTVSSDCLEVRFV